MGRAFEFRKERKFKRWGHMAKTFTKIGKEITIAVKQGGSDVTGNPRLRALITTARAENMPKDNIERAIKKATDKDQSDYKEIVYEGYGPHGIAILVETATDNTNRTVANIRSYFNKFGGALGTSGSVEFMFDRKSVFKIEDRDDIDLEELELELIDYGVEEIFRDGGNEDEEDDPKVIMIYGEFTAMNKIQQYLESNNFEIMSASFERFPNTDIKKLSPENQASVEKLLELIEEDEDVQNVYHNMEM